jgi:hypothetical protein
MLYDGTKVLDADDSVNLVLRHIESFKLITFDSNGGMEWLLQHLWREYIRAFFETWQLQSLLTCTVCNLVCKASKIDCLVLVGIDNIEKLSPRAKVVHELSQR